jgi:hypothetical protein
MQYLNDPRPWTEGLGRDLSIVDLVANETILGDEVELLPEDIARVDLIAITRVEGGVGAHDRPRPDHVPPGDAPVRRRIVEIGLLGPDPERGVRKVALAAWDTGTGRLGLAEPPAGVAELARWAGVPAPVAAAAIAERADILARLTAEGRRDPKDVDDAVHRLRTA